MNPGLPCDMPGYHGSEADAVEPRESCADCGEWLTGDECENCAENREEFWRGYQDREGFWE